MTDDEGWLAERKAFEQRTEHRTTVVAGEALQALEAWRDWAVAVGD